MKLVTLLMTTVLASGLMAAYPAMAAKDASGNIGSPTSPDSGPTDQELRASSSEIIGNISIANIALAYGMYDDATGHIDAARQAIAKLNGTTPYSSNAPVTAGKLSYATANGNADYWIPVANDRFVVRTIDGDRLNSRHPGVDISDAQIVHYNMVLDTKVADAQLVKAQTAISQKQYDVAMTALDNVSKGAITETVTEDRPLEAARDNLILSKELLHDKDYHGASFALKHASKELALVEKANPDSADNTHIKNMQSQIDSLQASIAKADPSDLKIAEIKIDGWIKDVKSKL